MGQYKPGQYKPGQYKPRLAQTSQTGAGTTTASTSGNAKKHASQKLIVLKLETKLGHALNKAWAKLDKQNFTR